MAAVKAGGKAEVSRKIKLKIYKGSQASVASNEKSQNSSQSKEVKFTQESKAEILSEVDSEEETELRKICARDFSIDEKYEDYDPKDLKYIYGHELSLIKEKRKAQEKEEENKDSR